MDAILKISSLIKGFFDDKLIFDGKIDTIIHSHVFEHVYFPDEFIKHISNFLEEGQKLIFSIPNMEEMLKRKYTNCLKGFKKSMKDKGVEDQLIMFLSGMGGTGKSEVIKAFVEFAKGISIFFDWNYDSNVIKVSAYTGAAACQIPNGRTLHSTVGLCSTNSLSQEMIDSWKSTKVLIIDEVSFLSEHLLEKTEKHMRILKEEKDVMFGGCHIIFIGDFFQLLPVGKGQPLFKGNTLQFGAINKAIFLNISHRFDNDHTYGEMMRIFRIGLVSKEDKKKTNTRSLKMIMCSFLQ